MISAYQNMDISSNKKQYVAKIVLAAYGMKDYMQLCAKCLIFM